MRAEADHAEFEEQFSDYYDGELDEARSAEVKKHLASCDACKSAYEEFRKTVEAISGLSKISAPAGFEKEVESTIEKRSAGRFFGDRKITDRLPLTVIAIIGILIGLVVYLWLQGSETGSLDRKKDSGEPIDKETRDVLPQP